MYKCGKPGKAAINACARIITDGSVCYVSMLATDIIHILLWSSYSAITVDRGASTPYKRWNKCTMEKVRGRFLQPLFRNLGVEKISLL